MSILNFLLANWDSVLLVIIVVAAAIVLYRRGETALLENLLFALVTKAEREFGSGTGELKRATVIGWVYERLPRIAQLVISQKTIERLLENALEYAKQKWTGNPALLAYIAEGELARQIISFTVEENEAN